MEHEQHSDEGILQILWPHSSADWSASGPRSAIAHGARRTPASISNRAC